ncbi:hypothetical protein OQA88_9438 [Cercophora sp. LCS_1]
MSTFLRPKTTRGPGYFPSQSDSDSTTLSPPEDEAAFRSQRARYANGRGYVRENGAAQADGNDVRVGLGVLPNKRKNQNANLLFSSGWQPTAKTVAVKFESGRVEAGTERTPGNQGLACTLRFQPVDTMTAPAKTPQRLAPATKSGWSWLGTLASVVAILAGIRGYYSLFHENPYNKLGRIRSHKALCKIYISDTFDTVADKTAQVVTSAVLDVKPNVRHNGPSLPAKDLERATKDAREATGVVCNCLQHREQFQSIAMTSST